MNLEECGFVLSITPYREHDGMVHFLGETVGLVRLVLPGYYKANSKQGNLGLEFTYVRYRMKDFSPNRLNRILNGERIDAFRNKRNDYEWLLLMSLMSEITIKTYDGRHLDVFYEGMKTLFNSDTMKQDAIFYMREIIEVHGFKPYINGCVVCGKSQINDFSIEKGGFLCPAHVHSRGDKAVLTCLYELFSGLKMLDNKDHLVVDTVFRKCVQYIAFHGDVRLQSWKLWNEL